MNRRVKIDWKPTTQTHAYRHTYIYIRRKRKNKSNVRFDERREK